MNRNIKILGILAAVFALMAVSASSAMAVERYFHQDSGTTAKITGEQTVSHVFTTNAGTVTCKTSHFHGTTGASTTMELTLEYTLKECTAFGFIGIPVDMNGCHYVFTSENTTVAGQVVPNLHITCPAGKSIQWTVPGCTTAYGPQTMTAGTSFTNGASEGKKDITMSNNIAGITYNECGTVRTNGAWTGTTTLTCFNNVSGVRVNCWYE